MHRLFEVQEQLGIPKTTLIRRSDRFAEWLSFGAVPALTASGAPAPRLYTDEDVALLRAIGEHRDAGASFDAIALLLERGELAAHVVARNDDNASRSAGTEGAERGHEGPVGGPGASGVSAVAPMASHPLMLALEGVEDGLARFAAEQASWRQQQAEQHAETLAALTEQTAALRQQTAVNERLLAALEAQAPAAQEAAPPAPSPAVVPEDPVYPRPPAPLPQPGPSPWARLRRRLTGQQDPAVR